jgi:DNA-directed RNA polymerase subunit RPC12/RpoP
MIIECTECGTKNTTDKPLQPGRRYRCGKCGTLITFTQTADTQGISQRFPPKMVRLETSTLATENTSGQGKLAVVPQEIKGWNWGAFLLGIIWGACNNVWWSLLLFIPYFDIVWVFVMGIKGSEWAWRSKKWDSIEHFKKTQKKWRDWGIGLTVVVILIWFILFLAVL